MRDICGGGCIRRGADTRFIGVKAALDAHDQTASGQSAEDRAEIKCVRKDKRKHMRDICDIRENDDERDQHIGDAHERHDLLGQFDDALAAAHDAVADCDRKDDADNDRRDLRIIEAVDLKGGL